MCNGLKVQNCRRKFVVKNLNEPTQTTGEIGSKKPQTQTSGQLKSISAHHERWGKTRIPDYHTQKEDTHRKSKHKWRQEQLAGQSLLPPKPDASTYLKPRIPAETPSLQNGSHLLGSDSKTLRASETIQSQGPTSIPNIVLTKCADILRDRLHISLQQ